MSYRSSGSGGQTSSSPIPTVHQEPRGSRTIASKESGAISTGTTIDKATANTAASGSRATCKGRGCRWTCRTGPDGACCESHYSRPSKQTVRTRNAASNRTESAARRNSTFAISFWANVWECKNRKVARLENRDASGVTSRSPAKSRAYASRTTARSPATRAARTRKRTGLSRRFGDANSTTTVQTGSRATRRARD